MDVTMAVMARSFAVLFVLFRFEASASFSAVASACGMDDRLVEPEDSLPLPALSLVQRAARQKLHDHGKDHRAAYGKKSERSGQHHQGQRSHRSENENQNPQAEPAGRISREIKRRVVVAVEVYETVSSNNNSVSVAGTASAAARAAAAAMDGVGSGSLSDAARTAADAVAGSVSGDCDGDNPDYGCGGDSAPQPDPRLQRDEAEDFDEHKIESSAKSESYDDQEGDEDRNYIESDEVEAYASAENAPAENKQAMLATPPRKRVAPAVASSSVVAPSAAVKKDILVGAIQGGGRKRKGSSRNSTSSGEPAQLVAVGQPGTILSQAQPIGAALGSVIAVTLVYFMVTISLASARTWNQARQHGHCTVERVLESTVSAVYFAPMLCAVFLAVTKRAESVAHGDPALYGLPPPTVQVSVIASATAFCAHALFWFLGECSYAAASNARDNPAPATKARRQPPRPTPRLNTPARPTPASVTAASAPPLLGVNGSGDAGGDTARGGDAGGPDAGDAGGGTGGSADAPSSTPAPTNTPKESPGWIWFWLSHLSVAIMHISLNVLFIGITLMREPEAVYRQNGSIRMSAGTTCTLILAIPYFAVYLVLHALQSQPQARSSTNSKTQSAAPSDTPAPPACSAPFALVLLEVAKLAATALSLVPMLCVLFLGTQLVEEWAAEDGTAAHPPPYVELFMYMCTAAVLMQLILAVVAPFAAGAELHGVGPGGELDFVTRNHGAFRLVSLGRWIVMTLLYIGVEAVCQSLWTLTELLTITRLLRHLVGCYFLMYAIQWLVITLRELVGSGFTNAIRVLRIAKDIMSYFPMLAVLFLESWVRPQHLVTPSGRPGVPQSYAQDCMYLATVACLVQLLIVLLSGIVSRSPVSTTSHRNTAQKRDCVAFVLLAMFNIATLVLCISIAVVVVSLFTLTPENANDNGSWVA